MGSILSLHEAAEERGKRDLFFIDVHLIFWFKVILDEITESSKKISSGI